MYSVFICKYVSYFLVILSFDKEGFFGTGSSGRTSPIKINRGNVNEESLLFLRGVESS